MVFFNSGGGSGPENAFHAAERGDLKANVAAFITNTLNCGCVERAKGLKIPHELITNFTAEGYGQVIDKIQQKL